MNYLFRDEQKEAGQMLYRWHPKLRAYQYWDVVGASWLNSTHYLDRKSPPTRAVILDYQETWAEPEV
jgi:hypothetical protein